MQKEKEPAMKTRKVIRLGKGYGPHTSPTLLSEVGNRERGWRGRGSGTSLVSTLLSRIYF